MSPTSVAAEAQGVVVRGGDRAPVGQRRALDGGAGMSFEDAQALAGGEVPEP